MRLVTVTKNEAGQRLEKLMFKYMNLAGKSFIYKMIRKKNITLNGKKCDGSEKLAEGDEIRLFLAEETIEKFSEVKIQKVKKTALDIVYEDKDVIFINKPAGMLSQKAKDSDESLVEYLIDYLLGSGQLSKEELKKLPPLCLQPAGPQYQRSGGCRKEPPGPSGSLKGHQGENHWKILSLHCKRRDRQPQAHPGMAFEK